MATDNNNYTNHLKNIIETIEKRKEKSDIGTLTRIWAYCKRNLKTTHKKGYQESEFVEPKSCKNCGKRIFDIEKRICGTSWDYCACEKKPNGCGKGLGFGKVTWWDDDGYPLARKLLICGFDGLCNKCKEEAEK